MSTLIRILFVGDIVGTPGMNAVTTFLPSLMKAHATDLVVANGENAHDGKSISEEQFHALRAAGVDVVTSGNHIWEKWHIQKLLSAEPRLIRPLNYPREAAGRGFITVDLGAKGKVGVINLQGRTYMQPIDCPFRAADHVLERLRQETAVIIVDMHAEATAEKIAMAWHLDGRVSAVLGTHTHIQTADARIFPEGTGFITDVGMTGPYDSVVGMRKDIALKRFIRQTPFKFEMASDDVHLSAVVLEIDAETGRTRRITPITYPEFHTHVSDPD